MWRKFPDEHNVAMLQSTSFDNSVILDSLKRQKWRKMVGAVRALLAHVIVEEFFSMGHVQDAFYDTNPQRAGARETVEISFLKYQPKKWNGIPFINR